MNATNMTHATVDDCMEAEDYLPSADNDTVIDEETGAETHTQTVECPTCGREYDYTFTFTGVYDPDQGDYTSPPDRFEEVNDAAYYGDQTYNVPIHTEDNRKLELVYHLDALQRDGEVLHRF